MKLNLFILILQLVQNQVKILPLWFKDSMDIRTINTGNIIPVDLNAFMYKFESNMLEFYKLLNKTSPIDFEIAMKNRKIAMDKYLWNATNFQWFDYSLTEDIQLTKSYPSNWFPLWSGAYDNQNQTLNNAILESFLNSGLVQPGGVQSSTTVTGQQWDSPNVWAPHQSIVVKALQRLGTPESISAAEKLAHNWIEATYIGYENTQMMHEKYNAYIAGEFGGGGEYPPQIGFGWTNGVTLEFLDAFSG
jgi:alpha,alpha-trehalase